MRAARDDESSGEESVEIQIGPTVAKVHRSGSVDLEFLSPAKDAASTTLRSATSARRRSPRAAGTRAAYRTGNRGHRKKSHALAAVPVVQDADEDRGPGLDAKTSQILEFDRKLEASLVRSGERADDNVLYEALQASGPSQRRRELRRQRYESQSSAYAESLAGAEQASSRPQAAAAGRSKYLKWFRHTRQAHTDLVAQEHGELPALNARMRAYHYETQIPVDNQRAGSSRSTQLGDTQSHIEALEHSLRAGGEAALGTSSPSGSTRAEEGDDALFEDDDDCLAVLRAPFDFLHSEGVESFRAAQKAAGDASSSSQASSEEASKSGNLDGGLSRSGRPESQVNGARAVEKVEQQWKKRLAKAEKGHRKREMHLAQAIVEKERAVENRERQLKKLEAQMLQLSQRVKASAQRLAEQKRRGEAGFRAKLKAAQVQQHKERLTRGAIFLKHGRRGKPHLRLVYCDPDLRYVFYAKLDLKKVDRAELELSKVHQIVHGHKTPEFKRSGSKESVGACFSLQWADYTLNLEIPGYPQDMPPQHRDRLINAQRKDWLAAFHWAVARARGEISEDDDEFEDEAEDDDFEDYDDSGSLFRPDGGPAVDTTVGFPTRAPG